mmetsp:Transcript_35243/g.58899  ORF Transcript_35243/g.58899 Transcript_35243/m.58899 type:complete len:245 (+) Transcript_35243:204-938(+)
MYVPLSANMMWSHTTLLPWAYSTQILATGSMPPFPLTSSVKGPGPFSSAMSRLVVPTCRESLALRLVRYPADTAAPEGNERMQLPVEKMGIKSSHSNRGTTSSWISTRSTSWEVAVTLNSLMTNPVARLTTTMTSPSPPCTIKGGDLYGSSIGASHLRVPSSAHRATLTSKKCKGRDMLTGGDMLLLTGRDMLLTGFGGQRVTASAYGCTVMRRRQWFSLLLLTTLLRALKIILQELFTAHPPL